MSTNEQFKFSMNLDEEEADNIILVKIFQWRQDSVAQLIFFSRAIANCIAWFLHPLFNVFLRIIDLE